MKSSYDFSAAQARAVLPVTGKARITLYLDKDILDAFRAQAAAKGKGYQTLINDALRLTLTPAPEALTLETLRRVIREELHPA